VIITARHSNGECERLVFRCGGGEGGSIAESSLIDDTLNGNPRSEVPRAEDRPAPRQESAPDADADDDDADTIVRKYVCAAPSDYYYNLHCHYSVYRKMRCPLSTLS
jgi:hypothetical protein